MLKYNVKVRRDLKDVTKDTLSNWGVDDFACANALADKIKKLVNGKLEPIHVPRQVYNLTNIKQTFFFFFIFYFIFSFLCFLKTKTKQKTHKHHLFCFVWFCFDRVKKWQDRNQVCLVKKSLNQHRGYFYRKQTVMIY